MALSVASTSSTSTSTSSTSSSATTAASEAYTTFLTVLTTELTNQNPLDPTDTSEFTGQLIQLASLEQQVDTNSQLETMTSSLNALTASMGIGYMGSTVTADGDTAPLQDGSASWVYTLDGDAESVTLTITDEDGNTVWTGSGDTSEGSHTLTWDGTGTDGNTYSDGSYTLTVSATDADGDTVSSSTQIVGTVTGVDSSGDTTELLLGDVSVDIGDINSIKS